MGSSAAKALVAVLALLACLAPTASADGLPVPVDQTFGEGVVSADGSSRFVTIGAGGKTVVMAISTHSGEVTDHTTTDGTFTVPAIAVDGTASGLSADGETLALISPRQSFPRKTTEFQTYEAQRLRRGPQNISLDGDFSFDALSPDGETMYVIQYTDRRDPGAYQVHSYDLAARELDPEPILDSEESPDDMRGFPMTRATSPDGSWEYTLYDGGGAHPFIHALDVAEGATVCIDLEMLKPKDTYGATLEMAGDASSVELTDRRGELRAVVDTSTFKAAEPGAPAEPARAPAEDESGLKAAGVAVGGLLVAFGTIALRRRRRPAP